MKKVKIFLCAMICIMFFGSVPLFAGGSGSYPNGAEGFLVGAAPPPGFYLESYTLNYGADTMEDNTGKHIGAFDKVSVWAEVFRFIWISKKQILGGNYGQHIFLPFLDIDLDFKVPVGPKKNGAGGKHYSDFHMPYIIYSPFVWTFHKMGGKLHYVFSLVDVYIPTGDQDDDNMATVSHNFWTFEPVFAVTYFPTKNWAMSFKFMYDWSTKQDDAPTVYGFNVDRTPGQEFHFDYNFSYAFSPNFRFGVGGYVYTQTTDDDYDIKSSLPAPVQQLLKEDEGHHTAKIAIGPGLWFHYKKLFMTLKVQPEVYVRNGTKGVNSWLKLIYCF